MDFALITGASRGLGRAFALELAQRGYNLLLVSLPNEEIGQVADVCRTAGVECHTYETDLTDRDSVLQLTKEVSSAYRLCMLINNAGTGGSKRFEGCTLDYLDTMLRLNITASTLLIHQLLPILRCSKKSFVLNISSMASLTPTGYKTVYPASKEFVRHFSIGLREELRGSGVSVSTALLGPMPTQTEIVRRIEAQGAIARFLCLSPEKVATECIDKMLKGHGEIVVGWSNRLSRTLLNFMPVELRTRLMTCAVKRELQ